MWASWESRLHSLSQPFYLSIASQYLPCIMLHPTIQAKAILTTMVTTDIIDTKEKYITHSVLSLLLILLHITIDPIALHPLLNNIIDFLAITLFWIYLFSSFYYYHFLISFLCTISVLCCILFLDEIIYSHDFTQKPYANVSKIGFYLLDTTGLNIFYCHLDLD